MFAKLAINTDLLYKLLGERIQASRKSKKLSQAKLADRLEMTRSSIVNIEKGRQHPPLHVIWRIAEELHTEVALLIPDHVEFDDASRSSNLTSEELAKIEAAAAGNHQARRQLEAALQRVRKAEK